MLRIVAFSIVFAVFYIVPVQAARYIAQDIEVYHARGGKTQIQEVFQDKNLLLYFCFSGFKGSAREAESLNLLQEDFVGSELKIVFVIQNSDREPMEAIIKKHNLSYISTILIDDGSLLAGMSIYKLPAATLINKKGKIIKNFSSPAIWQSKLVKDTIALAINMESD